MKKNPEIKTEKIIINVRHHRRWRWLDEWGPAKRD